MEEEYVFSSDVSSSWSGRAFKPLPITCFSLSVAAPVSDLVPLWHPRLVQHTLLNFVHPAYRGTMAEL